jgi:dTDP-4-amino-4,6-dideoxygalactose transaminase
MRIGRSLPPAAAPFTPGDLVSGLRGLVCRQREKERLREELRHHFKKKHCFLVSSGRAALVLVLLALKEAHPDRDEVLMPAFACYSIPSAIVRAGLKVRLCDIDPDTLDFDFEQLAEKMDNPHLLCVIPIHLFGLPADIERLKKLLSDPAVTVVEDAAQAMGGEWGGKKLGTMGEVGIFSLGRGKAISTVEGGVILTDCDGLARTLRKQVAVIAEYTASGELALVVYALALLFLLRPAFYWIPNALPFLRLGETRFDTEFRIGRMSAFQAGLTRGWRKKLARFRQVRQFNAGIWAEVLSVPFLRLTAGQKTIPDLIRFPFLADTEEEAKDLVKQSVCLGLGIGRTYPDAISGIAALQEPFSGKEFPGARQAARRLVTLPVHGFLTGEDRRMIFQLLTTGKKLQKESA